MPKRPAKQEAVAVVADPGDTVAYLIADRMGDLRPAELKVARTLMTDYPAAGLGTVAELAKHAGVSAPTVVRFAVALGFDGFSALQSALKTELRLRAEGPLGHVDWAPTKGSSTELMVRRAEKLAENAVTSLKRIPPEEFERAVRLLSDTSRKLFLSGGRYSSLLARDLALNLETIRPRVRHLADPFGAELSALMALGRRDVFVLFDFHRYQKTTIDLAKTVRERGATIILVTDEGLSPAAASSQIVLPVSVSALSPFYTFSAGIMLTELLALSALHSLGEAGRRHHEAWETVRSRELIASETRRAQ